ADAGEGGGDEQRGGDPDKAAESHRRFIRRPPRLCHRGSEVQAAVALPSAASPRYGAHVCGIFGAAMRMNSDGDGGVGRTRIVYPASSTRRSALRRLQGAHDVTTFSHTESPPRLRGTTWSSVSLPAEPQ